MLNGAAVVRRTKLAEHVYRVAAEREAIEKAREKARQMARERERLRKAAEKAARSYKAEIANSPYAKVVAPPTPAAISRREERAKLANVIDAGTRYFGISLADLSRSCNLAQIVMARQVIWYVAYEDKIASYPQIGAEFSRDHTTILSGVKKVRARIKENREPWVGHVAAVRSLAFSVRVEDQPFWGS